VPTDLDGLTVPLLQLDDLLIAKVLGAHGADSL